MTDALLSPNLARSPAEPEPEEARWAGPRETSGMTSSLLLGYVERTGGHAAVERMLARCGVAEHEAELRDECTWFSLDLKLRLFEAAAEVLDDPLATRRMGESALDTQVASGLKLALRALGSPAMIYKNVGRANAKFSARHQIELVELGKTHARLTFGDVTGAEVHPLDCQYTQGLLSCAPGLFGLPPARISHPSCAAHGAAVCVYDVSWDPGYTRPLVICGAGATLAFGLPALLAPALLPAGAAVAAAAAAVGACQALRARRARWRQLRSELADQVKSGDRLSSSLQDLVSELRLEEVLDKITGNARAAVGGKEFALLVDEPDGLRCQSSSGLPAESIAALERWARTAPVLSGQPVVVDDAGRVPELEALPAQRRMPLGSLCAVPLVYRRQTLGLLVALGTGRVTFLPRDVDLLQAYANQAAIALTNARLYEAQEALATRDPLTGLLNHREFHERIGHELERLRRQDGRLAIVLLDLDGFKSVNDESGHAAGDRVLRRTARALESGSRSSDLAFRVGGDEFALVLPGAGREAALEAAERVRVAVDAVDPRTSASFGVAVWPEDGGSKDVLLAHADGGLYAAKASARRSSGVTADGAAAALGAAVAAVGERRLAVATRLAAKLSYAAGEAEIARTVVEELDRSLGYVLAVVLRLDPDGVLRVAACAGPLTREIAVHAWTQRLDEGVSGRVARTGTPALIEDTAREPDHLGPRRLDPAARTALRSELAVPIAVDGKTWGVLDLEDTRKAAFDAGDLLLAGAIAAHLGAALHRAALQSALAALRERLDGGA